MNCVVVDVGNTCMKVALAANGRLLRTQRLSTRAPDRSAIRAAVRRAVGGRAVEGAAYSSVVPRVNRLWLPVLRAELGREPVVVSHRIRLGVGVDYPHPETIGADRLANASGAVARYGAPVIVADFGTALVFDVIDGAGSYVGGVIAPGLLMMTDYLAERTALLPHIRLRGRYGPVGRSTVTAMRIGAKIGYRGLVREIATYLRQGLGNRRVKLIATGGFAAWVLEGLDLPFIFDPDLKLFGLSRIFTLNSGESARGGIARPGGE